MHYHILWGSNATESPSVLNFSDREEAIGRFMEIVKTVEGTDKAPPPWDRAAIDDKTRFFRMVSATHKYILVYCDNGCSEKKEFYPTTLN